MRKIIIMFSIVSLFACQSNENPKLYKTKKQIHTELGYIKFDQTITNFRLATIMGEENNMFLYSRDGEDDLDNTIPTTGFYFETIKGMNFDLAKEYLDRLGDKFGTISNIKTIAKTRSEKLEFNGAKAVLKTYVVTDSSDNKVYLAKGILSNMKNAILFVANDFDNGIYSEKFTNTFKSIEM